MLTHPKTQIFFMKVMGNLTLMTWMTECLSEFCFRKSDPPVLSEALHLPNYCTGQQGAI